MERQLTSLDTQICSKAMSVSIYLANKMLRASFDGIYVNRAGVSDVKSMIARGDSVVLVPYY